MNIAVLASHEGTTLQAVLDACLGGVLPARVSMVISNNSGSGALRRADAAGVPTCHISTKTHPDPVELDRAVHACLTAANAEVVLLAGFMKKLGPDTLRAYAGRILNTHPSLLPKFGGPGMFGAHVHRAVIASGATVSGASVHVVDEDYDTGAVVAQRRVEVMVDDTPDILAARVQTAEREFVVQVLHEIAVGARPLPLGGSPPMVPLMTERLILRALKESDLECVFSILNDETTTAGVSWRQLTRESAGAWLARRIESQRSRGVSMWAVEDRSSAEVVGLCGFFPHESQLELGYVIHARFWGRGFGTESATACVEHAIRSGYRIYATIRPDNRASRRVAEKAGLRLSGNIPDERGGLLLYDCEDA